MSNTSLEVKHMMLLEQTTKNGFTLLQEMTPDKARLFATSLAISRASGKLSELIETFAVYNCDANINGIKAVLCDMEKELALLRDHFNLERDELLLQTIKELEEVLDVRPTEEMQLPITE